MEDPTYHDLNIYLREIALKLAKATAEKRRLLLFWYYAGHGIQDNEVKIVLNHEEGRFTYPIES